MNTDIKVSDDGFQAKHRQTDILCTEQEPCTSLILSRTQNSENDSVYRSITFHIYIMNIPN